MTPENKLRKKMAFDTEPASADGASKREEQVNILLVDDHPANLLALEAILRDPTYTLVKAASGRDALKCLLDQDFAVILLDVKMPGIDGFETASLIRQREHCRHIPIIFLTAVDMSPSHVSRGYSVGAVDYLIKPFDPDILRSKVRGFVELYLNNKRQKDDSERRRKLELERQRTRLEEVSIQRDRFFALSRDMICLLTTDGVFLEANPAWERDLGLAAKDLQGRSFLTLFQEAERERITAYWRKLTEARGFITFEAPVERNNGDARWLAWSLIAFPEEERYYGVARDVTDRIQSERQLRKHEQELNDFFENGSLGIQWVSEEGTILRANRAQLELLGFASEDYVGKNLRDFHADPERFEILMGRLRAGQTVREFDSTMRSRDGSLREVLIDSNVLWEGDRFVHSRSFIRDVTAQRQSERIQSAQYAVTRLLAGSAGLEKATAPILAALGDALKWDAGFLWEVTADSAAMRCAASWSRPSAGLDAFEQAVLADGKDGEGLRGGVRSSGQSLWIPDLQAHDAPPGGVEAGRGGLRSAMLLPIVAGNGVAAVLELYAKEIRLVDETAQRMLGGVGAQLGQFIERHRAEKALRDRTASIIRHQAALLELADVDRLELSAAYRAITEVACATVGTERVSLWCVEQDGKLLSCRDAFDVDDQKHVSGPRLESAACPRFHAELRAARVIATGDAWTDPRTTDFADLRLRGDGNHSAMFVAVVHHGQMVAVLAFKEKKAGRQWTVEEQEFASSIADRLELCMVSEERRKAEEEVRRLNVSLEARIQERTAQYQEALQEQEQFAYSVSHDLRAPLRAMFGFSQALYEDYSASLDAAGRDYAKRIMDATGRMAALIKDLLEYSRLSRSEIQLVPVPLSRIVEQVLKDAEMEIRERRAEVRVDAPMPSVKAHEVTLFQVVTNLVSNAVKFVAKDVRPSLVLRAETKGSRVRFWIEDNGIGIAPVHQERVFRVFERLNRSEHYPGTGIGLAIVRKAMARMGGDSGVVSDGKSGCRFWIELDRAEPNE